MPNHGTLSCDFKEIELLPDGRRRVKCRRCKRVLKPTRNPLEAIIVDCVIYDGTMPGDKLTALLESVGLKDDGTCACKAKAQVMNRWGLARCQRERKVIEGWLEEAASKRSKTTKLMAGVRLIRTKWFRRDDPYGSILDEVFRQCEVEKGSNGSDSGTH